MRKPGPLWYGIVKNTDNLQSWYDYLLKMCHVKHVYLFNRLKKIQQHCLHYVGIGQQKG
jgi:hypothetical protein